MRAIKASTKNWERIRDGNCNKLLSAAYKEAVMEGLPWITSIKDTFEQNGMMDSYLSNEVETRESHLPHNILFNRLILQLNKTALQGIKESSKLGLYSIIKQISGAEKYLTKIPNTKHRIDMTRLRLCSHSLNIETGRHNATKREDRICALCSTGTVEDEIHALTQCSVYDDIRKTSLHREHLDILERQTLTDQEKAVQLLKSDNIEPVAKCIHEIFNTRNVMLDSLFTLNTLVDRIAAEETHFTKIENDVRATIDKLVKKVERIEKPPKHGYRISKISDNGMKMSIVKI